MIDKNVLGLLREEEKRQIETITLIPSENYASAAVRELLGSVFTNKYSEGYLGRRYYQGNKIVDEAENLAIERAKKLFGVPHANVQPYSGSPANSEVFLALLEPGETVMGMGLSSGGHLTHGHPNITFSGKYFNSVQFGVEEDGRIDYEKVLELAKKEKPKLMIIGTTAYPLILDWKKFGEIADSIGAWFVADISHVAGLIVAGVYPTPVKYAHVITTTTHKTLRGPRGAIIMATDKGIDKQSLSLHDKDKELAKKIDRAVFPGMQGGPHDNVTAAIAQCLYEAEQPEFKEYGRQVIENAKALAAVLSERSEPKDKLTLVGGSTESHLILIDLRPQNLSGNVVAEALEVAGIVTNRNSVPGDTSPFYPSGLRIGTPAVTTRGMGKSEMEKIAEWILAVIDHVKDEKLPSMQEERSKFLQEFRARIKDDKFLLEVAQEVKSLCSKFPTR
ncbi:MAG TPA: serine hydroxymethyltransferase [Candidatus Blackburnbacteria bacterium]|nr:serine hydroxymethyltransferase [Candidatus Blackburnbacteria bacterium]